MLRTFRRADIPAYLALLLGNFPVEGRLIGFRPEPLVQIVRKLFRPDIRLLLGLMRLAGQPVFRVFVVEAEGHLASAAILTFGEKAGYVSSVVTDPAFRRRGFARQIMHACRDATRRAHRPFVVLDVLSDNVPARTLYEQEGYTMLRHVSLYSAPVPATPPPSGPHVRPISKKDLAPLAELANSLLSPKVREVLPVRPRDLGVSPMVTYGLASQSEAWVIDDGAGPVGFLRATVGAAMESAHLTQPILGPTATADAAQALVAASLAWVRGQGAERVVAEVPQENVAGVRALVAAGFQEAHGLDTLVQSATP